MASTTTASNLMTSTAWFGELASALQGTWHAAAAATHAHGEDHPRHQHQQQKQKQKPGRGAPAAAPGTTATGRDKKQEADVVRCGGAMSDTTLYMLLDRFTPS